MEDDYEALRMSLIDRKKKEIIHKPILNNIGDSIDFGFQAVNQTQEKVFTLENKNDYQVEWNFESEIFQVFPSFGTLDAKGGKQTVVISFTPQEASAILNTIILNIDKEKPRIIKVSGIGKYPFIQPQARKIHFNTLLVGKSLTREVIVKNLSQVGTKFTITKLINDEFKDSSFSINCSSGFIPPQSSFLVSITYKPQVEGLCSIAHWKIEAPGGNSAQISAIGDAEGFNIRLSDQSINFGEVKIETEASRILTIYNDSDLPTKYQFYIDQNSIFSISKPKGIIKDHSYVRMLVQFVPRHTICYYQRVFCVVQNHKVIYVDLIGTCYDLLFKPLPLVQQQIDSFRKRVIEGRLSNIDMKYMENSILLKIQQNSPLSKRKTAHNLSQQLAITNGTNFSIGQFGNYSQLNNLSLQQQSQINNGSGLLQNQKKQLLPSQSHQQLSVFKSQSQQEKVINPNNRYTKNNLSPQKNLSKNKSLLLTKEKSTQITSTVESSTKQIPSINQKYPLNSATQNTQGGTIDTINANQNLELQQQQYFDRIPETYEDDTSQLNSQIALHRELFLSQTSGTRLIRISEEFLDFGYQELMTLSQERVVTIFNNINSKITVFWTILKKNNSLDNSLSVFSVQPETASIKPNSRADFKISFRPIKNSFYFFQDLQFIAYKYSEKLTKNVVDEFQKSILAQSMKFTNDQLSLTHTQSQNSLKTSTVFLKTLNKIDYIADETLPPFSGFVSCVGHSFGPHNQIYIPMVDFSPSSKVYFKSCRVGEVSYQSVELQNQGDTPVYFRVQKDPSSIYNVYPQVGLIQPKQFILLVIQFAPQKAKKYEYSINIVLNHNNSNIKPLSLYGFCSEPLVDIENDGKLFFPPSFLGVYSKQKMKVENRSKINLEFDILIPDKYKEMLHFEPQSGVMKPNEHVYITCGFVPYQKKNYKIKPIFKAKERIDLTQSMVGYFMPGSGSSEQQQIQQEDEIQSLKQIEKQLEVVARGADGSITIKPELIDYGIVKVNFQQRMTAQIRNDSNCTFYIELKLVNDDEQEETEIQQSQTQLSQLISDQDIETRRRKNKKKNGHLQINEDEEDDEQIKTGEIDQSHTMRKNKQVYDQETIHQNFKLDFTEGIISANSKIDIGIVFCPNQVNFFNMKLEVIATECNPKASIVRTQNRQFIQKTHLKIKANGNYPLLKIIDVRNDAISVASLWENFQINKINSELATDLNEDEINFLRIEQLNIEQAQKLQRKLKNYTWNFGYLPNNKNVKPRKIVVTIQNIGGTELDFNFKLPSDSQIDLEPWADPGELQGDEAYEKAIIDRKIFQIIPKSGTLKPQQLQDIQLIYSPGNIDDGFQILSQKQEKITSENHLLRVVLQINNGKPLVINLKGMMLSPTQGMLSVKQNRVNLPDCPIGMLLPLQYPIEIQNVGLTKLNYSIEVQEIDEKGQNIDSKFEIFNISNKNGSLMPNEKQYLYCLFKPLEAKKYYHILSIKATDFMKPLKDIRLHVIGEGFSKIPKKVIKTIENEYPQQRSSVSAIGSKVCFSIEEIDFGELKPHQQITRVIILYNLSNNEKLSFDFTYGFSLQTKAPGLICEDKFSIEPSQGRLNPGEFIELKLTLEAALQPSIYSGEIECAIYWGNQDIASGNRMVTTMSSVSSHSGIEKETLFLRIKKQSKLSNHLQKTKDNLQSQNSKEHMMMNIIGQAIKDILNDDNLFDLIKRIDDQPVQLYQQFDKEDTMDITMVSKGLNDILDVSGIADDIIKDLKENYDNNYEENNNLSEQNSFTVNRSDSKFNNQNVNNSIITNGKQQKNKMYNDYRQIFLQDEFSELADLIFENTYFNIIQEATRRECDLLRVGKNFIIPQK
ncbi:MSP (major sperm protein) domain protein (macronuclear) [Tetrahymena thermophila SB210]|uniref:MSP (Major sperm protein) domain protein n=1 Tax=Tetrahymena thermophila (strain SB210) TaxID=312017 RepID=I7M846_TETTS|nr:MSP (major sperm protein) domain protein [Tetrahymena thermophila SB210]EAR97146.2 MSP (major sperm protein) domain protein [Tetrahymena thermophila SB210]|eukprot:XP_001017391.2 MSP (major sperm protein) domain protein [Tetrahymena thermophila SB210]